MDYRLSLNNSEREKLRNSRVCIVGCGGTGGYVAEYLIRLGVGTIVAVDGDRFDSSNLNRQILATKQSLGFSKSEAVKLRAESIKPDITVFPVTEFLSEENADDILKGCDLVIDALDNLESRKALHKACSRLAINMIFGAVESWRVQVGVLPPNCGFFDSISAEPVSHGENVLAFIPSLCASVQVSEAVKLLCTGKSELMGKILNIDLLTNETITIEI